MTNPTMINYKVKYSEFIKNFIINNRQLLDILPVIGEPDEDGLLGYANYLADNDETVFNIPVFVQLFDDFYEQFINIEGLTFNIDGHLENYDGRTFKEVVNDPTVRQVTKESCIRKHQFTLCVDIFDRYGEIQQPEIQSSGYTFLFMTGRLENFINFQSCPQCSESIYMSLDYKSNTIKLNSYGIKECPSKIEEIVIDLEVPSKKLVFLNNPYSFINIERDDRYEITDNSVLGRIKTTESYASSNIGFFHLSNTSPTVFKHKERHEILVSSVSDESDEYHKTHDEYDSIGNIITDLWWYTVLDYDLFISLCTLQDVDIHSIDYIVVPIKNKKCTITHKTNLDDNFNKWFSKINF